MKMKSIFSALILLGCLWAGSNRAAAQGTAFTFRGQVLNNGLTAAGTYPVTFTLYTTNTGGSAAFPLLSNNVTFTNNGLFSVNLDYGTNVFDGPTYWMEVAIYSNGTPSVLSPRQQLTPTPYAIFASTTSNFSGTLPSSALPGNVAVLNGNQTFTGTNTFQTGVGSPSLVVYGDSGISTNYFSGLGFQYFAATGEGAITSSFNDGYGFLSFYTKEGSGDPITRRMTILADGNVGVANSSPTELFVVGGSATPAYCNGTTWVNGSDRNAKQDFSAVDPREVLEKVSALPITEWQYKVDAKGMKHIGPMAQDFHAAFGLNGDDDKHIATVDEDGVALAAIQGLNQKVEAQAAEIQRKNDELQRLKEQNASFEERLNELQKLVQSAMQAKAQ
jgi:hypothetical protein